MWPSKQAEVSMELMELLWSLHEDLADKRKVASVLPADNDRTLEQMGFGGEPIGLGELLEVQNAIERHFKISFTQDELPHGLEALRITFGQIVDKILQKLSQHQTV
jgi:hypothetical protein